MTTFYVDLDRTLFRTECAEEIFAAIEKVYPDATTIRGGYGKRREYYVFPHRATGDETTYYHDLVAQLCDAGLEPQAVFSTIHAELSDGRFEYPGASSFISLLRSLGEVKILTYGEDAYQRFKASLCLSLQGTEVITLIGLKSEYLNSHASAGDWIIDDKRLHGLAVGIRALCIQHVNQVPADVHSLAEAGELIRREILKERIA